MPKLGNVVARISSRLHQYAARRVAETGLSYRDIYDRILAGFLLWEKRGYPGATHQPWWKPHPPSQRKQVRVVGSLMDWKPFYGDNRWYCRICKNEESRNWQEGYRHLHQKHREELIRELQRLNQRKGKSQKP